MKYPEGDTIADLADLEAALRLTEELQEDLAAIGLADTVLLTRPAYYVRIEDGKREPAEPSPQFAAQFRLKLSRRHQHLRDYCIRANQKYKLELFLIYTAGSFPMGDYDISVRVFRSGLKREQALLQREITEVKASGGVRPDLRTHGIPDLGQALHSTRRRKGHSQEEAASRIGCATSTISRIERGLLIPRGQCEAAVQHYIEADE